MVPTLTCGLSRSNFSFATFCSLLYRLVCPPLWRRTSEIYLTADFLDCSVRSGWYWLARPRFHDLLGDVRRHLLVGVELHRVRGASLRVGAQVGRVPEHLAQRHLGGDRERVAAALLSFDVAAATAEVA